MKKLYVSLLLISHGMYPSSPDNTKVVTGVVYKQDVAQLKQQLLHKKSLQELSNHVDYTHRKKQELSNIIAEKKIEIDTSKIQIAELQKRLKDQNNAWLAENNKKFEPQISIAKAQAALARYQRLSPQMQWQEAQYCVIPGVCTPEGIMHYWQAKVNGNLAEEQYFFNQQKQQRLNQIASDRLPIVVTQIPASLEYKKMLDEQYQDLQSNAAAYDDLHQNFSNLRNNQAAVKVTDSIRRVAAKNKLDTLRQEHESAQKITTAVREFSAKCKLYRLQEEERVKIELLEKEKQKNAAITIESMYRGILARRKIPALRQQRDERSQMMAEENKTRIVMQQERELLVKMVYEQEQADKLAKEKEAKYKKNLKKREHDKKKKLQAREQEERNQLEIVRHKKLIDALAQQVEQCIVHTGAQGQDPQGLRIAPFKSILEDELFAYEKSLKLSGQHNSEQIEEMMNVLKQEQNQKIQAKLVEYAKLAELLKKYKLLLEGRDLVEVQLLSDVAQELIEKDIAMRAANEKGLSFFVACDPAYFIEISDILAMWQHNVSKLDQIKIAKELVDIDKNIAKIEAKIKNSSFDAIVRQAQNDLKDAQTKKHQALAQRDLLSFVILAKSLQTDGGILNPQSILGAQLMQKIQSPEKYQYLSDASIKEIQDRFKVAIELSIGNPIILIPKMSEVMHLAMTHLDVFSVGRPIIAEDFVRSILTEYLESVWHQDDTLENRLKQKYFDRFLLRNNLENAKYSRAQLADLAKIYTMMVMMMLQAKQ